jgi:hypothetical protein
MKATRSDLVLALAMAVGAAAIPLVQPRLAATVKAVRAGDDAAALPPPRQLRAMSSGYRSAVADLLWAKMLVEQGVRRDEKRTFEALTQYLDAIIELEPDHQTLYQFVDTLLIYPPGRVGTEADARKARTYLERGIKERPDDHDLWLRYGQFIAFLGPGYLSNEEEIERWRTDGALAIARAVDLGASTDRTLAASSLLAKAGKTKATIRQLQNHYALTEDGDTRQQILLRLQKLHAEQAAEDLAGERVEVEAIVRVLEEERRTRYPFLTKGEARLVGPYRDPALCAGPAAYAIRGCPNDWNAATRDVR